MDVLEMKEDAARRESEQRDKEAIEFWNKTKPIGTLVCGPYSRPKSYRDGGGSWVNEIAYGKTTSAAYLYNHLHVVVDVEGNTRVPIDKLFEPAGSSPALGVRCSVCDAPVGSYCKRDDGSQQVIAHKKRRGP